MTVYVDDMLMQARVGRLNARWSHLIADTPNELHEFAARLGLLRSWFQVPKPMSAARPLDPTCLKAQMWHYDVTAPKREQAIRLGAVPVTRREMTQIIRDRHARLFPEQARVLRARTDEAFARFAATTQGQDPA